MEPMNFISKESDEKPVNLLEEITKELQISHTDKFKGVFAHTTESGIYVDFLLLNYFTKLRGLPDYASTNIESQENLSSEIRLYVKDRFIKKLETIGMFDDVGQGIKLDVRQFEDLKHELGDNFNDSHYLYDFKIPELKRQLAVFMVGEKIHSNSELSPDKIFYDKEAGNHRGNELWIKAIDEARELANNWLKLFDGLNEVPEKAGMYTRLHDEISIKETIKPEYKKFAFTLE